MFWNKIFSLIRKTIGFAIKQDPTIALLNCLIPKTSKPNQTLIWFILLGAKMTITRSWKSPTVSFRLAKQKITWIMMQEKISNTILDTLDKFKIIWEPWASQVGISL